MDDQINWILHFCFLYLLTNKVEKAWKVSRLYFQRIWSGFEESLVSTYGQ